MMFPRSYIYMLVLIEGAAVMAAELMGAKLIGPFYGNSLYIWASVLGITLFSLTLGYYLGGVLSLKYEYRIEMLAVTSLTLGALGLGCIPYFSLLIMTQLISGNIISGAIVSLLVFLFPALCFFGISSEF
jgi:hypothetical protein